MAFAWKTALKNRGRVMATSTTASLPAPATSRVGLARTLAEISAFWHQSIAKVFNPYRPELHYMRGPGPAWRAKHPGDQR